MSRPASLLILLTALLATACSAPMPITAEAPSAAASLTAEARSALELAEARVQDAKQQLPDFTDADRALAQARSAALQGNSARVLSLARQALARVDMALGGSYLMLANQELQKLYAYTGLSDAQLDRIREIEAAVARNDGRRAYELIGALKKELADDSKRHKVARGESLWTISARPDIYANPWLWPLIWQANRDTVKTPTALRAGQTLKIRANPTVDEVVDAVNFAHQHSGTRINIGEVKEVTPGRP